MNQYAYEIDIEKGKPVGLQSFPVEIIAFSNK